MRECVCVSEVAIFVEVRAGADNDDGAGSLILERKILASRTRNFDG